MKKFFGLSEKEMTPEQKAFKAAVKRVEQINAELEESIRRMQLTPLERIMEDHKATWKKHLENKLNNIQEELNSL